MQLIPARGRLPIADALGVSLEDAAYPREGTVTLAVRLDAARVGGCSLSPRGDGYLLRSDICHSRTMQLIPARGRLLRLTLAIRYIHGDAAYPREGTVTDAVDSILRLGVRCSLAPRGDGYIKHGKRFGASIKMQLSPARGRLQNIFNFRQDAGGMQLSPARGRLLHRANHRHGGHPDAA